MAAVQLSVVVKNEPGTALDILSSLAKARVDLRALMVADTADLSTLRLVVSDPAKAKKILAKKGMSVSSEPVLPVKLRDKPGALAALLGPLAKKGVNIEYMYGSACACSEDSCGCTPDGCEDVVVVRVRDVKKAEAAIKAAGFKLAKI